MAAGDVADGEGHGEYGEAEGERDARKADAELRIGGGKSARSAAAEDQPKGAEELCKCPSGDGHEVRSLTARNWYGGWIVAQKSCDGK